MLRLIRVDTLRRVHNVGFLTERLSFKGISVYDYLYPIQLDIESFLN